MTTGAAGYRATQYSVGQMLLDPSDRFRPARHPSHDDSSPKDEVASASANSDPKASHIHDHIRDPARSNPHNARHAQSPLLSPEDLGSHSHGPGRASDRPIARLETPFLVPSTKDEEKGQVDLVVFAEGLVQFKGKWFLYYGQADETLGVAVADVQN